MTFLTILGIIEICSFRLVIQGKTGKEIPKSWRLVFLEKSSANNFALSEVEDNTSILIIIIWNYLGFLSTWGDFLSFSVPWGDRKKMLGCGLLGEPVPRQTPRLTQTTLVFSVYSDTFQFSWYLIRLPCELFSPYEY